MRRIARLGKPCGWKAPARQQSIAPCAATPLSATARTAAGPAGPARPACPGSLRFYSQNSSLPRSLVDAQAPQPPSDEILHELERAESELAAQQSSAFRPPPTRTEAAAPNQVSDPAYTPALSSDGLSTIGGLEDWWDKRENWNKAGDFAGFKAKKKIQDPRVLEAVVRRAVVEATVLIQAGRTAELASPWPVGTEEELSRVLAVKISSNAHGAVALTGEHGAVAEDLNWDVQESREAERVPGDAPAPRVFVPSPQEAGAYLESWDRAWRRISLADATFKFAVTKRVFQLTGQLVPDHKLNDIKSVSALIATLIAPPKAKTLSEEIQKTRRELISLPNVAFSSKQVTRGDKAKAIGQYKIIEEEFKKRDLQDGHLAVPATKEKHWFKGAA
ncbi:hypothetical protein TruAng_004364 [Truncatella angustata]|nr:hypothetical protein TruAng_004364 [Truncatella angustata]